jgi:hypothetical protein
MEKYTLEELKDIARINNLPVAGTKAVLWDRVQQYVANVQRGCRYVKTDGKCKPYDGPNIDCCVFNQTTKKCGQAMDTKCMLKRHTKEELVNICRTHQLPVSGNKEDLWARVCNVIDLEPYVGNKKGCKLNEGTNKCIIYDGPDTDDCNFYEGTGRCRKNKE